MPHAPNDRLRALADLALGVYLEDLVAGRKVLYLGDSSSGVPQRLARSARSVYACDTNASSSPQTRDNVTISAPAPGSITIRESVFDVVVAPDLAGIGGASLERLEEIRRSVSPGGVLVAGAFQTGPSAIPYEELHGLLSRTFEAVRMVGQAPLAGWAIVDFAPGKDDVGVTFDQSLLADHPEEAERFLALCGRDNVALDAYSIVQVHLESFLDARRSIRVPAPSGEPAAIAAALETELRAQKDELDATVARGHEVESALSARTAALADLDGEVERLRLELAAVREESETRGAALRGARIELERFRAAPPQPIPPPPPPPEVPPEDHARLEAALVERGRLVAELRQEVERRAVLVRDVGEELAEARRDLASATSSASVVAVAQGPGVSVGATPGAGGGNGAGAGARLQEEIERLRGERETSVERALGAEAARAETAFALDELRGRLAAAERERDARARAEAELAGGVRGLRARIAEIDEAREGVEARLALARHDRAQAGERILELERALAETRDSFELELVRSRSLTSDPSRAGEAASAEIARLRKVESDLAAEVGTLRGRLAACLEQLDGDRGERDHARAEAIRLTALIGGLEEHAAGARRGFETRVAYLEHDLQVVELRREALRSEVDGLEGERDGLRARLADREAALAALASSAAAAAKAVGEAQQIQRRVDALRDEADALRAELAELRVSHSALTERAADAESRSEHEALRAADLASSLAARDALVTRLETDLAEREQRCRTIEQNAAAIGNEAAGLREALAAATAAADAREELGRRRSQERDRQLSEAATRAAELESERDRLADALTEARNALEQLAAGIQGAATHDEESIRDRIAADGKSVPPPTASSDAEVDGLRSSLGRADAELGQVRARIDALTRDAEDREMLMRSLVAQLEERDDRIRALGRRLDSGPGGGSDAEQLGRELLELQERSARLADELAQEREARRSAEGEIEVARQFKRQEHESEVRRLHELLGDRDAEVVIVQSKATRAERDLVALRDSIGEARHVLESLLSTATSQGDPATADRVGQLLKLLARA